LPLIGYQLIQDGKKSSDGKRILEEFLPLDCAGSAFRMGRWSVDRSSIPLLFIVAEFYHDKVLAHFFLTDRRRL